MAHGSPHNRPVYIHSSPQGAIPLVPQWVLPDGRIVYSNPGTPNQSVIYQAPTTAPLPPLTMPPGHFVMTPQPAAHPCPPNCVQHHHQDPNSPANSCPQCPQQPDIACPTCTPKESTPCKPGCTQCAPPKPPAPHEVVVASATRMEAEHWVARILGFDMDYLRTLPPAEFQAKINVALDKAQEKRRGVSKTCPLHPHAHSLAACAPRAHAHRRETEEWLERILEIPRAILRQRTTKQLNALVNGALAEFQVHHR